MASEPEGKVRQGLSQQGHALLQAWHEAEQAGVRPGR